MNKSIAIALCLALAMPLTSCGNDPASQRRKASAPGTAIKWFDCLHGDELVWDDVKADTPDAFPGVTFRWQPEQLEAVTDGETVPLYGGAPIWSVYFHDLTGDGKPELCSTVSMGSGMIDQRIIVYDYAGGASYELSDRGDHDFVLTMREDALIVEKRVYAQEEVAASGALVFLGDAIQMQTE